jgi:hypothetical protein
LRVLPAAVQGDGCLGCWRAIGRGPGPVRSRLAGAAQDWPVPPRIRSKDDRCGR